VKLLTMLSTVEKDRTALLAVWMLDFIFRFLNVTFVILWSILKPTTNWLVFGTYNWYQLPAPVLRVPVAGQK